MSKFNVGDRVIAIRGSHGINFTGKKGTYYDTMKFGICAVIFDDGGFKFQDIDALELVAPAGFYYSEIDRIAEKVAEILAKKPQPKEPEKPQTKYKAGDEVVIRKDLKCGVGYKMRGRQCGTYICSRMLEFCGKTAIITHACDDHYRLQGEGWWWTDDMFAGLASEMPKMARFSMEVEMPKTCFDCDVSASDCAKARGTELKFDENGDMALGCIFPEGKRRHDCPLVEVPR